MTVEAMLPYNHGAPPVKTESDRTESPVVLHSNPMQDYAASPVATSYSSSRASSSPTLSSDHHYSHHPHHHHITSSSSRMQPGVVHGQTNPPVPVRSASWVAGGAAGSPQNVPTVITTKAGSTPNFAASASGSTPKNPNAANTSKLQSAKTVQVPAKKKQNTKNDKKSGDTVTARRQKRLERNRESARLSRRRRKQYLEVLEDRVKQLSIEMDSGRRKHAAVAIETIVVKREEVLSREPTEQCLALLDGPLSRTSEELSVLATFNTQQLKSFALPADSKFVLWLTLQGDTYFRGGRAASERLSAARIGERMLNSGNDRVAPTNPMWPLLCNEIGLSYDQEERVRNYQRTMLQETYTWLDRHSARSSSLAMQSFHDSLKTVACATRERDYRIRPLLSESQRLRFLSWAHTNADRIKSKFAKARHSLRQPKETDTFKCSPDYHVAANLYILNDRLQKVMSMFPQNFPVVSPGALKRLSRRPSFESLGQQKEDDGGRGLTRASSFASSGSLKRSSSPLSMGGDMEDEDKPQPQQVSPEDGEEAAAPAIEKELGFVKEIIPKHVPPTAPPAPAAPVAVPSATAPSYHFSPLPMKQVAPVPVPQSHISHGTSHPTPIAAHPAHGAQHSMSSRSAPTAPESYSLAPPHYPSPYAHAQYYQQYPGQSSAYSHAQAGHHYHQPPQQPVLAPAPPQPPRAVASHPAPSRNQKTPPSYPPQHARQPSSSQQASGTLSSASSSASGASHQRKSSFLPPHLNVVPEEMFPATEGSDDFFMSLMDDEDWAIGGGVDMDTSGS